ncbi:MAG: Competence/damage-inducible CinA-like protein [Thermoleophilia bacterium]|nr:Competence/damage-inducible CinA-like protein [Thermoleophilia bacterium]
MTAGGGDVAEPSTEVRARIVITGDELLRGFIRDANGGYLAERIRELGLVLDAIRIVGDDFATIERELAEADAAGIDVVIVTGGLGPTHDDRTSEAVARALGVELELREDALEVVEARVRAYGRMRTPEEIATFTPGNRKQATMPAGAQWVDPLGTAPGFTVGQGGRLTCVLPGPPSELRHAWRGIEASEPLGAVLARVGTRHERLLRVWGVPESRASQVLAGIGHEDSPASRITICARDGELELAMRGTDAAAVDALFEALDGELGSGVFARDDHREVAALVAEALGAKGWRAATAESCTGGMLGSILTSQPGSSAWYLGGVVAYANQVKVGLAHVDEALLEAHGAVSEPVARALAAGACSATGADVGIGITGVAGPGGGTAEKPVGTVHVAISMPSGDVHRALRMPGDRETIRRRTCAIALHELRIALTEAT